VMSVGAVMASLDIFKYLIPPNRNRNIGGMFSAYIAWILCHGFVGCNRRAVMSHKSHSERDIMLNEVLDSIIHSLKVTLITLLMLLQCSANFGDSASLRT
jgi:hypothetical protein